MEEKPILDYLPPMPRPSRMYRLASITTTASATFLVPSVVTTALFLLGAVPRHWLTGYAFDEFIGTAAICNGAGILLGIFAIVLGRHHPAALFIFLHMITVLLRPSFGYA